MFATDIRILDLIQTYCTWDQNNDFPTVASEGCTEAYMGYIFNESWIVWVSPPKNAALEECTSYDSGGYEQ